MASKVEKKGMLKGVGIALALSVFMATQFDSLRAQLASLIGRGGS